MKIKFFLLMGLAACFLAGLCGCTADVTPILGTWERTDIEIVYTLNADMTYTKDNNYPTKTPHESGTFEYDGKSITFDKTLSYDTRLEEDSMYWSIGSMELELKKQK